MAVFTTLTKQRLSWQAPAVDVNSVIKYYIDIGDDHNLLISNSFKLVIAVGPRIP